MQCCMDLQALASLPAVRKWLKESLAQHNGRLEQALDTTLTGTVCAPPLTLSHDASKQYHLGHALHKILPFNFGCVCVSCCTVLSEEEDGIHSPAAVLRALIWHRWTIDHQQQVHAIYILYVLSLNYTVLLLLFLDHGCRILMSFTMCC